MAAPGVSIRRHLASPLAACLVASDPTESGALMDTLDIIRIVASLLAIAAGLAIAGRRVWFLLRLLRVAQPMPDRWGGWGKKIKYQFRHVLGQEKILRWTGAGLMHVFVFWGFLILQSQSLEALGEVFDPDFHIPLIGRWEVLGFLQDLFSVLVLVGITGFALIRLAQSPRIRGMKSRFAGSYLSHGWYVLLLEFGLLYTVMILRATRAAHGTLPYPRGAFASQWLGQTLLGDVSQFRLDVIATVFLVAHICVIFGFLVFTVNSKHLHIFSVFPNVLFARLPKALGALEADKIDVENMSEDDVLGVGEIGQFGFKRFLDMYTCTECGRCQSQCPAWNTGKPLSPKLLIMDLRDHLYAKGPYMLDPALAQANGNGNGHENIDVLNMKLVGDAPGEESVIDFDVLWACTTCGACVEECPVDIEHVDAILDLRRYKVQMESSFPQEAGGMLRNVENSGDPWGLGQAKRMEWADGLDVPVVDGQIPDDVEYLFWVGCAGALEDRSKKVTRTVAGLLNQAGVKYAVLGKAESCNGDPARRLGMEYLFQMMAQTNVELLNGVGARKIVVWCPHCFNTLANEYPAFGGNYTVIHHTQLL
ncbi:MAG TPA: (Fe-S)-binding protein, partial [Chloroflexota bacterium]|nr:(Fe-S)-binding protein [Chloroflexota bacterium]